MIDIFGKLSGKTNNVEWFMDAVEVMANNVPHTMVIISTYNNISHVSANRHYKLMRNPKGNQLARDDKHEINLLLTEAIHEVQ